ncbi:Hypothetical predicted protein [Cloeon dipterum]|uniref:Uncharacterized protein n=1 Tax=Cloeon dipterum TaxID=197152 RepID=A0A8S1CYW9_9INSE|nr:Hypothetical predicted protein [Cloeon dipterum]
MFKLVAFSALLAVASAGNLLAPAAYASPLAYGSYGAYAAPAYAAQAAYAPAYATHATYAAPAVVKTVAPVATSYANTYKVAVKSPACRRPRLRFYAAASHASSYAASCLHSTFCCHSPAYTSAAPAYASRRSLS